MKIEHVITMDDKITRGSRVQEILKAILYTRTPSSPLGRQCSY